MPIGAAIGGLTALAGGLAAKKLAGGGNQDGTTGPAQSPHALLGQADTGNGQPPTPPPSLSLTGSDAALQASQAAARQKKKATGGFLDAPQVNQPGLAAAAQPKTLLGY